MASTNLCVVCLSLLLGVITTTANCGTIAGQICDLQHSVKSSGIPLQVNFDDIRYQAHATSVDVKTLNANSCEVSVALDEVMFQIGSTSIPGLFVGANCGPLPVVFGTKRDMLLRIHVRFSEDIAHVEKSAFDIGSDNLEVGSPVWVNSRGLGATRNKVVAGLRAGLLDNRESLERLFCEQGPDILEQIKTEVGSSAILSSVDRIKIGERVASMETAQTTADSLVRVSHQSAPKLISGYGFVLANTPTLKKQSLARQPARVHVLPLRHLAKQWYVSVSKRRGSHD